MKGLYMVDADRGFVQYFENLLFTHSNEYKMLGHNFKANEFLLKVKERPDLLDKIDLLFINPKLNDLNGLELYKKIQSQKKDINVCILVNENIKTFYENDIAELGIENVILYPNSDEYYLENVKNIFNKIEDKKRFNLVGQSNENTKKDVLSDKDLFSELNSEEFLSQFDFDSLSSDIFSSKANENNNKYESKKEEPVLDKPTYNQYENNEGFNEFKNPSPAVDTSFGYNNSNKNDIFDNPEPSFVTPNFVFDDDSNVNNSDFMLEENEYDLNSYNQNSFDDGQYKDQPFGTDFNANLNEQDMYNETYKNTNSFTPAPSYTQPSSGLNNNSALDLGAFGVGVDNKGNKDSYNIFESPEFGSEPKNDNIFGSTYDNKPNMFEDLYNTPNIFDDPYVNNGGFNNAEPSIPDLLNQPIDLGSNDFEAPYENKDVNKKSNLQNINRPDIDAIDTFSNYGEEQVFSTERGYVGYNDINSGANIGFDSRNTEPNIERHLGFNNPNNQGNRFGFNNANSSQVGGPKPYKEPETKINPYDEYLNLGKKEEVKNNSFNGYPSPNDFSPKQEKPFGGFDFGKSNGETAPEFGGVNQFVDTTLGGSNTEISQSQRGYGGLPASLEPFGGEPFDNTSTKSYIENMYNKAGVEGLNYTPATNPNSDYNRNPIRHEKTSDASYSQVPDFARQVVAFYSTKGGIGKTSLAVNATIQLAKYSKKKICLIDFDLTNANVHTHLGILDSTYDLSVVSNFESEIDSFSLSRIVTPYRVKDKNGDTVEFDVIVGFKEMKMAQRFSEKEVYKILSILEEMYDIVIVDTHPVYTDVAVSTILKKATKIVFVTEQEMTALNGAKDFILASRKYNIPSEKLFMVLNRYKPQTSIFNKNRIEKGLNKTVLATIPFDMDSLRDAVNTNNPVTISNPDSELARAYIDVAKIVDTKLVVPEENKSFFKLFKK